MELLKCAEHEALMEVLQIVFGNRRGWRSKNGDAEDNINMDT
jgi:hypothetical protein